MNENKIAVILCTYEPCRYLYEQVISIEKQRGVNCDIHIYDDGSSEKESLRILNDLKNSFSNINCCKPSGSAGKNFIRALDDIDISDYDYIAFSDQDDIWLEDKMLTAINEMEKNDAVGYSSDLTLFDGNTEIGTLRKSKKQTKYDYHFQAASAGCTYVLSKELVHILKKDLKKYNYINHEKNISHDWLVYYLARTNNKIWYMDFNSKILYRQHESNVYGANRSLFKKVSMVFGSWYSNNVEFVSYYRNSDIDNFNVNSGVIYKISKIKDIFKFRRELMNSVVCYIFWMLRYNR